MALNLNLKDLAIDDEVFQELLTESNLHEQKKGKYHSDDKPKFHTIPKGVANMENLFDPREIFRGPKNEKIGSSCPIYETINLGTSENPKNANLCKKVSKEDKKSYLKLFKEYQDVFSWSYRELKTYDTRIIQHTISLKSGIKPFQQKLGKYHPSLEPLMYQEMKKLLDAKIIFQVRHSARVAIWFLSERSLGRSVCVCISETLTEHQKKITTQSHPWNISCR
jgi:hypothetical protein